MNCTDFEQDLERQRSELQNLEDKLDDRPSANSDSDVVDYYDSFEDLIGGNKVAFEFDEHEKDEIAKIFDPINAEHNIVSANGNPSVIDELTDCQLNHVLNWQDVIEGENFPMLIILICIECFLIYL